MFVGREHELGVLEDLAESPDAELYVLYGRRRVGKTELLQQFCGKRRSIYFLAAQVREKDNLRVYRDCLAEGLGDASISGIEFPDWGAALEFTAQRAGDQRLVVLLDEFPYLCEGNKGLPSILQRFWDTVGKKSRLMVILCGSQVSFMEREVLAERSPLFGRRTGQSRLEPLEPIDALQFFPTWPVSTRVLAYAILGGMPAYLRRFRESRTIFENLSREMLRPEGYLFDEVQFLLRSEFTSPATYSSILAAVSRGAERVGDVALAVGIDSTTANRYLTTLRELRLVQREVPLTEPDPLRSRKGTYSLLDRFLAFHFRHVQPHIALIHAGRGARVFEQFVEPDLERLFDDARLDFVLSHLRREAAELIDDEVVETARYPGRFVRAVARTSGGKTVVGVVVPEGERSTADLEKETGKLSAAFGSEPIKLVYGLTSRPERPLEVERVPEGEIL